MRRINVATVSFSSSLAHSHSCYAMTKFYTRKLNRLAFFFDWVIYYYYSLYYSHMNLAPTHLLLFYCLLTHRTSPYFLQRWRGHEISTVIIIFILSLGGQEVANYSTMEPQLLSTLAKLNPSTTLDKLTQSTLSLIDWPSRNLHFFKSLHQRRRIC